MISESRFILKMEDQAAKFNAAISRKDWGVAHNLVVEAVMVTAFCEVSEEIKKKIWGDWDSDDGTETNTALDNGLFSRRAIDLVNRECCIKRNMAYEDQVCRREGRPLQYYGDADFCAICRDKKRAVRHWDDSLLDD